MSEQLTTSPEQQVTRIAVEDMTTIAERYKNELPIVPASGEETDCPRVYVTSEKQDDGQYEWRVRYQKPDVDGILVNPVENPDDQPVFDLASEFVRNSDFLMNSIGTMSEAWWNAGHSRELIKEGVTEVFRVESGDKSLDILNCTTEALTLNEQQAIQAAMQHVASYTGNKVFDRAAGIILASGDHFQENSAGFYNFMDRTVRVNMDVVRQDATLATRYQKYFADDANVGFLEVIIAHELGHSMDINTLDEVALHGIDKDSYHWNGFNNRSSDFSVFDDKFGWTHHVEKPLASDPKYPDTPPTEKPQTVHRINDAMESECGEYSPTGYGRSDPKEDFAESFAIAALGGDTSKFGSRTKVIAEALTLAEGSTLIGPQFVTLAKQECADGVYRPLPKITQLEVEVIVAEAGRAA